MADHDLHIFKNSSAATFPTPHTRKKSMDTFSKNKDKFRKIRTLFKVLARGFHRGVNEKMRYLKIGKEILFPKHLNWYFSEYFQAKKFGSKFCKSPHVKPLWSMGMPYMKIRI